MGSSAWPLPGEISLKGCFRTATHVEVTGIDDQLPLPERIGVSANRVSLDGPSSFILGRRAGFVVTVVDIERMLGR